MERSLQRAQAITSSARRGGRIMKIINLRLALQTAIIAVAVTAAGHADAGDSPALSKRGLQAKIEYCKTCHGTSGQGFQGFYTAPRLAGQTTEYLENQFRAIAEHKRDNPAAKMFMAPILGDLSPATRTALAKYFNGLNAAPVGDGPRKLVAAGEKIYNNGVPETNVPACAACHGPDAKGIEMVPSLAGQLYPYTVAQLTGWTKGLRAKDPVAPGEPNTMTPIASSMTKAQISAVAAYLSYLK
jgi:cytochrome c553